MEEIMLDILKKKKGILFDVGWTLVKPASGDWMLTKKLYEYISREKLDSIMFTRKVSAMRKANTYLNENHKLNTLEEELTQFQKFYEILNKECDLGLESQIIDRIAYDRTYNMNNYILLHGVNETLKTLQNTHRLGIISDTWPSIELQMDVYGIRQYFDSFTYSCYVGAFKPDSKMYLHALTTLGLQAQDVVFIDDSIENLKGAAKLGIDPILIAVNPAADVETEFPKIYSVEELVL